LQEGPGSEESISWTNLQALSSSMATVTRGFIYSDSGVDGRTKNGAGNFQHPTPQQPEGA